MAELIKSVAIAWASGQYTESLIKTSLKEVHNLNDYDIELILDGCNTLQIGMNDSLKSLCDKKRSRIIQKDL
ncbi:MAG: hypothetical protein ACOYLO_00445 [Ferruginibacter sp.]